MSKPDKPWVQSKTIWSGIVTVLIAAIKLAVAFGLQIPPELIDFLNSVVGSGLLALAGAGAIYGRKVASQSVR